MGDMTKRIPIPKAAMDEIRKLIRARPMTPIEQAFRAGVAMGMGIDRSWLLDDENGEFIHPSVKENAEPPTGENE